MKIAILEPNPGQLSVYSDVFCEFNPDLFNTFEDFKNCDGLKYDIIILSHRINGYSWKDVYDYLNSNTIKFIVTHTFSQDEYRGLEPEIYKQLNEIRKYKNVQQKLKDEYRKIYDLIDTKKTFMGIKEIAMSLISI